MSTQVKRMGQTLCEPVFYDIGGKEFYQATLVLGQSTRLAPYFDGVKFQDLQAEEIARNLGDRLGEVFQIVLVPKGHTQKEHVANLEAPGKLPDPAWYLEELTHVDAMDLVDDFFVCNLDSSLLLRATKIIQGVFTRNPMPSDTPISNGSAPLSPEATQPVG